MTLKDSELYNHMRHKFFSMANSTSAIPESSNAFYYVREPHGKRPARNVEVFIFISYLEFFFL